MSEPGERLGPFQIEGLIGSGGNALVYEAFDPRNQRRVALKILRTLGSDAANERLRERLAREADAMARLQHPNVVGVYETGRVGDRFFVAMEYIEGRTLRVWQNSQPRSRAAILGVFVQAALGLSAAHMAGLVHRDFKPDNLLVGDDGRVRLLDLGLACLAPGKVPASSPPIGDEPRPSHPPTQTNTDKTLTQSGAILGTPLYMAPEQHLGLTVDERADQFAFCVSLYEALCGAPPFQGATYDALVDEVVRGRVASMTSSQVPPWLQRLLLRGLSVDPNDRYPSMRALIDELETQETLERLEQTVAKMELSNARAALRRGDRFTARASLRSAFERQDTPLARALWWQLRSDPLLWSLGFRGSACALAASPTAPLVALGIGTAKAIVLVDLETQERRIVRGQRSALLRLAFSRDGSFIASAGLSAGEIGLVRVGSLELQQLTAPAEVIFDVAFSPDGSLLATADSVGAVRLWSTETLAPIGVLEGHTGGARGLAFHPSGRHLAVSTGVGELRLWSLDAMACVTILSSAAQSRCVPVFSPCGSMLAAAAPEAREIRLWSLSRTLEVTGSRELEGHTQRVSGLAFARANPSPVDRPGDPASTKVDALRLVSSSHDGTLRVWDLGPTPHAVEVLEGHPEQLQGVAVDATGERIVSIGGDLRVWQLGRKGHVFTDLGHTAPVNAVSFAGHSGRIVSGGGDSTLRVWDATRGDELRVLRGHQQRIVAIDTSPDGSQAVTGSYDGTARAWDLRTGHELGQFRGHEAGVSGVAFIDDARTLVTVAHDASVRLWDVETHTEQACFPIDDEGLAIAPSADERAVFVGHIEPILTRIDLDTGQVQTYPCAGGVTYGVDASSDGSCVATAGASGQIHLLDLGAQTERTLPLHQGQAFRLTLHPDGRRVGVAHSDGIARIVRLDGSGGTELVGHRGTVHQVAFDPTGRLAVTAGHDGTVRLYEADTGRPVWRGPLVQPRAQRLFNHLGWRTFTGEPAKRTGRAWEKRVESHALHGAESGSFVAIITHDAHLEIWDTHLDRRLVRDPCAKTSRILASHCSFLVLADHTLRSYGVLGETWRRAAVDAACIQGDSILVAGRSGIADLRPDGIERSVISSVPGITGLCRIRDRIVLGFEDGEIELYPHLDGDPIFEGPPHSPALALRSGPMDTLIAGFANGTVAIWSVDDGSLLATTKLHGAPHHLHLDATRLCALSELGHLLSLDLGIFAMPYEELLREMKAELTGPAHAPAGRH